MDVVGVAEMPTMRMRRKVKRVRVSSTKIERLESHVSPQEGVKGILEGAKGPRRRRIGLGATGWTAADAQMQGHSVGAQNFASF